MSLDLFMSLFQGRADVFAEQQPDGSYLPVRRPITRDDYIGHGQGDHTYGIYTVTTENTTKFIVFDIDTMDPEPRIRLVEALTKLGIPAKNRLLEFSGRKGFHIWLPFEEWMPASLAYTAGRAVLQQAGVTCEVFPKQPEVFDGLGNLIKLPLGLHRVSGERSRFSDNGNWKQVVPLTHLQVVRLADAYEAPARPEPRPFRGTMPRELPPCMQRVLSRGVGEGSRDLAMFSLAVECKKQGMEKTAAERLCLEANDRFDPPLDPYTVQQKVWSAYTGKYAGLKCELEFLHDRDEPLCSTACQRYQPTFGAATDDGPPRGQSALPPALDLAPGQEITVTVENSYRRSDGRQVYVLSHPDASNQPVMVV